MIVSANYVDASDEQRRATSRLMDAETFARLEFWAWCAANRQWFAAWVVGQA